MRDTTAVWTQFGRTLLAFTRARVAAPEDAEDIVQEVMVRVHRALPGLDDTDKLKPWLYRITRNVIIDHYRARGCRPLPLPEDLPEPGPEPEMNDQDGLGRDIERCLSPLVDALPDPYRQAVRLADLENMPQADVAKSLGLSLSGAKSRIQRGRALLRGSLERCCRLRFDALGRVIDQEPTGHGPPC